MERVILARHGESVFSARRLVNGDVTVAGPLTAVGHEEARLLAREIAGDRIDLCVTSEFERTRATADLAIADRDVPRIVVPELNDPRYGRYEGGPLDDYRRWASLASSGDEVPGGGESRRQLVERYARGFHAVLHRPERCALVVAHSLPIAFVLAAQDGRPPERRMPLVQHAHPHRLTASDLARTLAALEDWCASPTW